MSRRTPDGSSDKLSTCGAPCHDDIIVEPVEDFEIPLTRTISTVTLGKNRMHPRRCKHRSGGQVQLYSINRGPAHPAIIEDDLVIVDILPKYARNENVLIPRDSWKNSNEHDKYGYLNTSRQEIKVMPEPIYTVGQDSKASEIIDFDELPSQRGIWTPVSCCGSECFPVVDDQWDEPPPLYYGFGKPTATKHANDHLSLYMFNKLNRQIVEAPVNPHDIAEKDRETAADYAKNVDIAKPNLDQKNMVEKMKQKGIEKRIRRKLEEGSYSNFSVNEKKLYGYKDTILRYTWKGKLVKLRKLLKDTKSQVFINRQDYCGRTALHYAASWDCPQTMKLLLSIPGIALNLQDADGKTALRKACEIKSLSCVKLLIEHGANPRIVASDRRNPFEYVIQDQGDEAIELAMYLYNDAQMCTEKTEGGIVSYLHQLCLSKVKVVKLAEELIRSGANINATEGSGRTPLILATQNDNPELVKLFLKYKADAMHIDLEYNNALKYAIPGETCYNKIKRAMYLQPKSKEGKGMIDGRLRASQKLRRDTKQEERVNSNVQRVSPTRRRV